MARLFRRMPRRLMIDVDTQVDAVAALHSDNGVLLRNIRRLVAWARVVQIPMVSTVQMPEPSEAAPSNGSDTVPPGRNSGKISYTILPRGKFYPAENSLDLPRNLFTTVQQVIFEKRTPDPFTLPRADRLLSEIRTDEIIVFGTGLDEALKLTVLGLLQRRKNVTVARDAVGGANRGSSQLALRQIEAKGARLLPTEAITGKSRWTGPAHLVVPQLTAHRA